MKSLKIVTSLLAASIKLVDAVQFAGMNIAGFDFGCATDGTCTTKNAYPPLKEVTGIDGVGQMQHFKYDDTLNIFRLPVGWQYLVNNNLGGSLDYNNFNTYNKLVQGCLNTGASCIIDIHNYARWNGGIIGQGGPSDSQFASLWSQLASKYAGQSRVIFGVMNEPHDLYSITTWGNSVQAAVNAIRWAGANSQLILLPGTNWASAQSFVSSGSADALNKIRNPNGSITGLIFDIHSYLDVDGSGTHPECVTDQIDPSFGPLANWLRSNKRQALLTETGGGNTSSCDNKLCGLLGWIRYNSDVYLGWVGWAAGSFQAGIQDTMTPAYTNGKWVDASLVHTCIVGKWLGP